MKGRVVILDRLGDGRAAAALMVDGVLEDILIDPPETDGPGVGAILRGRLDRPMKGQGGTTVRLPDGQSGFLRGTKGLSDGQALLVQVSGVAEPGKAVPLTDRLLFKSRHAIVTPGAPGLNVARSIRDEEMRGALRILAEEAMEEAPEDMGLILRSAAELASEDEILDDIVAMRDLATAVLADAGGQPELLVAAPDAHELAWRDWAAPLPDEVIEGDGAFADMGVAEALDAVLSGVTALPGGGTMVVEATRALIAVDVNTGGDTSPAAGLKANLAAARALPRALRLMGLGGQAVIDFAPSPKGDRKRIEDALKSAFRKDGSETALAGWTPLGNFELQRKRDRAPLARLWTP